MLQSSKVKLNQGDSKGYRGQVVAALSLLNHTRQSAKTAASLPVLPALEQKMPCESDIVVEAFDKKSVVFDPIFNFKAPRFSFAPCLKVEGDVL